MTTTRWWQGAGGGRSGSRLPSLRYSGLFHPRSAPARRAYCMLFSFSGGILLVTAGSVFCHVIARHPVSGGRAMHTPPLPLAVFCILAGAGLIIACVIVAVRFGMDDGDDSIEEDTLQFCTEDQLDMLFQRRLQQHLLYQATLNEDQHHRHQHCTFNEHQVYRNSTAQSDQVKGHEHCNLQGDQAHGRQHCNLQGNQVHGHCTIKEDQVQGDYVFKEVQVQEIQQCSHGFCSSCEQPHGMIKASVKDASLYNCGEKIINAEMNKVSSFDDSICSCRDSIKTTDIINATTNCILTHRCCYPNEGSHFQCCENNNRNETHLSRLVEYNKARISNPHPINPKNDNSSPSPLGASSGISHVTGSSRPSHLTVCSVAMPPRQSQQAPVQAALTIMSNCNQQIPSAILSKANNETSSVVLSKLNNQNPSVAFSKPSYSISHITSCLASSETDKSGLTHHKMPSKIIANNDEICVVIDTP